MSGETGRILTEVTEGKKVLHVFIDSEVPTEGDIPVGGGEFYLDDDATTSWVNYPFGFTSKAIMIENNGSEDIETSFDEGVTTKGKISAGGNKVYDDRLKTQIAVKSSTIDVPIIIEAW